MPASKNKWKHNIEKAPSKIQKRVPLLVAHETHIVLPAPLKGRSEFKTTKQKLVSYK